MMRTFIAYTLPDSFKHSLSEKTAEFRRQHPDFRWTPDENLHITLAFLGDGNETAILLLAEILEGIIPTLSKITICTNQVFTLPRHKSANVIALGFSQGEEEIRMTAHHIEGRLDQLTKEGKYQFRPMEKRPFNAHLTLARKGRESIRLTDSELKPIKIDSFIEKAVLFQSELTPKGAIYTPLIEFKWNEDNKSYSRN
jgi:2'-5' RNA ligase